MTVRIYPSKISFGRETIYNVIKIETDGYEWKLTQTYGNVIIRSRDNYPEMMVS